MIERGRRVGYDERMPTILAAAPPEGFAPARFTAEQFLRMDEFGLLPDGKTELVDGEIVEVGASGFRHAFLQARLIALLSSAVAGTSMLVTGDAGVVLGHRRVRAFDAAIVFGEPRGRLLEPADVALGVEIADTTLDRDLVVKAREYGEAGIAAYWVVDVTAACAHVLGEPGPEGYATRHIVRFGEPLIVPGAGVAITIEV